MKERKGPSNPNALLWWVAITALAVSGMLYHFLGNQANADIHLRQQRMLFPLVGIIIAGVCLIVGTAKRWFYPK